MLCVRYELGSYIPEDDILHSKRDFRHLTELEISVLSSRQPLVVDLSQITDTKSLTPFILNPF
jgi:hypothetical protein